MCIYQRRNFDIYSKDSLIAYITYAMYLGENDKHSSNKHRKINKISHHRLSFAKKNNFN